MPSERKKILLRLDPAVHDALVRWADDELRSTNAQIEFLLRRALADAGRLPGAAAPMRRPGRPRREEQDPGPDPAGRGRTEQEQAGRARSGRGSTTDEPSSDERPGRHDV